MASLMNSHQYILLFLKLGTPTKEPAIKLTDEQINFFQTNGFLNIDNLINDDKIGSIRDQCGQVYLFLIK